MVELPVDVVVMVDVDDEVVVVEVDDCNGDVLVEVDDMVEFEDLQVPDSQ